MILNKYTQLSERDRKTMSDINELKATELKLT